MYQHRELESETSVPQIEQWGITSINAFGYGKRIQHQCNRGVHHSSAILIFTDSMPFKLVVSQSGFANSKYLYAESSAYNGLVGF